MRVWVYLRQKISPCLFGSFLLVTEGDRSILDGIRGKIKVLFQRCLWHIPHQMKYTLWQDKVKRETNDWLYLVGKVVEICAIGSLVDEAEVIGEMIKSKKRRLEKLISYCKDRSYENTASYLQSAEPDMFTAISNRLNGKGLLPKSFYQSLNLIHGLITC